MNVVAHNILAMNANRMLGVTTGGQAKSTEKLSSGYKINRAADDAAGLSISEKMRKQIRELTQASANAQDGVSFCQIADGALNEVHAMLDRAKELAVKANNGTLSQSDKEDIQSELDEITNEIDRIHTTAKFNEESVFSDEGRVPEIIRPSEAIKQFGSYEIAVGSAENPITIGFSFVDSDGNKVDSVTTSAIVSGEEVTYTSPKDAMADFAIKAAAFAVNGLSQAYPNLFAKASSSGINIGLDISKTKDVDGEGEVLALASISISYGGSTTTTKYQMHIDETDYPSLPNDDAKKADLAAVIAHEMTHLLMYDTNTKGMFPGLVSSYPDWFVEGVAQTSSGDNGWVNSLSTASSDATVVDYMSSLGSKGKGEYGSGYLAAMFLGYAASGEDAVNSENIKKGLDKLLTATVNNEKTFHLCG